MLSSDESDLLNNESEHYVSESGSAGNWVFLFALKILLVMLTTPLVTLTTLFVMFVAWLLDFPPIGIKSNCDIVPLVVFVPIGVDSKGDRLIEIFWHPKS